LSIQNQIQVFQNEEFGKIEVLMLNGKPYFPATECATLLAYKRQYTSKAFRNLLRMNKIVQPFSRTGTPHDNAVAEAFFSALKKEELSSFCSMLETRMYPYVLIIIILSKKEERRSTPPRRSFQQYHFNTPPPEPNEPLWLITRKVFAPRRRRVAHERFIKQP